MSTTVATQTAIEPWLARWVACLCRCTENCRDVAMNFKQPRQAKQPTRIQAVVTLSDLHRALVVFTAIVVVPALSRCTPSGPPSIAIAAETPDASAAAADESTSMDAGNGLSEDAGVGCLVTSSPLTETPSGLAVLHHDGQSFVTWNDRAQSDAGAGYRYRLYRSHTALTSDADLANAEHIARGIFNHSGQLFGGAFNPTQRIDPTKPMSIIAEGGAPLPLWSGLWVANARENGCAYYAVIATDENDIPVESVQPGFNATIEPINERVAPHQPIKVYDSNDRGVSAPSTRITGTQNLPLLVQLHGSQALGGTAGAWGDYYVYFGDRSMGYQEGLPGIFSVQETHSGPQYLLMQNRDTMVSLTGFGFETLWYGYVAAPIYGGGRFAYPYTENRFLFMLPWIISRYSVDLNRVYCTGGSMGAWGTVSFAFRHPEIFAAVFPDRPRFRQVSMRSLEGPLLKTDTLANGQSWTEHLDSVRFVASHPADLPFIGWNVGRNDGYATWQENIDMVNALAAAHHGFAFAWNNGDHSSGSAPREVVKQWYPQSKFARNESYPAFSRSSIDNNLGNGDPANGDLEGGINLGFEWRLISDSEHEWSIDISNEITQGQMTVDMTPRRLQHFIHQPGDLIESKIQQGTTTIRHDSISVDANGLINISNVPLWPDQPTRIVLTR